MRAACVMMEKDEVELLEMWLLYHGYLFGFENLYIFDNGSQGIATHKILERYMKVGVSVNMSYSARADYKDKGKIIGGKLRELDDRGYYDFLFPSDCDEFIVLRDGARFTARRSSIHDYLVTRRDEVKTLKIDWQLGNIPGQPHHFYAFPFRKSFFAGGTFDRILDHGFHQPASRKSEGFSESRIHHVHFHNRPFPQLLERAKSKLEARIDISKREEFEKIEAGRHLLGYFSTNELEYNASFSTKLWIEFPEFSELIFALSNEREFGWIFGGNMHGRSGQDISGHAERSPHTLPSDFDIEAYSDANKDVKNSSMDPLFHYCHFGWKEKRKLSV